MPGKNPGPYGMQSYAVQQYAPVGDRRDFTEGERKAIAAGQSQWFPKIFQSFATPIPEMMASPGRAAALAGLLSGTFGAGIGAAATGGKSVGVPVAAGLGAGGLSALLAYYGRKASNEDLEEIMRRLPAGATKRDYMADPAVQAQYDRAAMIAAAVNGSRGFKYAAASVARALDKMAFGPRLQLPSLANTPSSGMTTPMARAAQPSVEDKATDPLAWPGSPPKEAAVKLPNIPVGKAFNYVKKLWSDGLANATVLGGSANRTVKPPPLPTSSATPPKISISPDEVKAPPKFSFTPEELARWEPARARSAPLGSSVNPITAELVESAPSLGQAAAARVQPPPLPKTPPAAPSTPTPPPVAAAPSPAVKAPVAPPAAAPAAASTGVKTLITSPTPPTKVAPAATKSAPAAPKAAPAAASPAPSAGGMTTAEKALIGTGITGTAAGLGLAAAATGKPDAGAYNSAGGDFTDPQPGEAARTAIDAIPDERIRNAARTALDKQLADDAKEEGLRWRRSADEHRRSMGLAPKYDTPEEQLTDGPQLIAADGGPGPIPLAAKHEIMMAQLDPSIPEEYRQRYLANLRSGATTRTPQEANEYWKKNYANRLAVKSGADKEAACSKRKAKKRRKK